MASVMDSSGDGVTGDIKGLSAEEGDAAITWSVIAVVGAAFEGWEEATDPRAGIRPTENLDVVDKREEREPGRKGTGEGILGVML